MLVIFVVDDFQKFILKHIKLKQLLLLKITHNTFRLFEYFHTCSNNKVNWKEAITYFIEYVSNSIK